MSFRAGEKSRFANARFLAKAARNDKQTKALKKMSFTITDLSDLKRLLLDHPEWRTELRELFLRDDPVIGTHGDGWERALDAALAQNENNATSLENPVNPVNPVKKTDL